MTPEKRSELGRKGGERTGRDGRYIAKIGRIGGKRKPARTLLVDIEERKALAERLLLARRACDLSAFKLSEIVGVSDGAILRIEKADITVGRDFIDKIETWLKTQTIPARCSSCGGKGFVFEGGAR